MHTFKLLSPQYLCLIQKDLTKGELKWLFTADYSIVTIIKYIKVAFNSQEKK